MSERKYSLTEIDRMRGRLYSRAVSGMGNGCWNDKELKQEIEDQLRTYMVGGVDPAELEPILSPEGRAFMEKNGVQG